jgi:hypothetical protein
MALSDVLDATPTLDGTHLILRIVMSQLAPLGPAGPHLRVFFSAHGYRQCNQISNAEPVIAGSIQLWKPKVPISRSSPTIMGISLCRCADMDPLERLG